MRRLVRLLLVTTAVVGVVALFALPGRTLLAQRQDLVSTRHRIADLSSENAKLGGTAAALRTNARIEAIARSEYGLVLPGEKAYAIVPARAPTTTTTTTAAQG